MPENAVCSNGTLLNLRSSVFSWKYSYVLHTNLIDFLVKVAIFTYKNDLWYFSTTFSIVDIIPVVHAFGNKLKKKY